MLCSDVHEDERSLLLDARDDGAAVLEVIGRLTLVSVLDRIAARRRGTRAQHTSRDREQQRVISSQQRSGSIGTAPTHDRLSKRGAARPGRQRPVRVRFASYLEYVKSSGNMLSTSSLAQFIMCLMPKYLSSSLLTAENNDGTNEKASAQRRRRETAGSRRRFSTGSMRMRRCFEHGQRARCAPLGRSPIAVPHEPS